MDTSQLLWNRWEYLAKEYPDKEAIVHWDVLDKPFRWSYSALIKASLGVASGLIEKGIERGDICAISIRHNRFFYPLYMGISAIGAIPAVLAYPNPRLHPEKFMQGLSGIAEKSGIDWIFTEKELGPSIKPLVSSEKSSIKGIFLPLEWISDYLDLKSDFQQIRKRSGKVSPLMPFLAQHSSGTTGLQKCVVLSHKAVLEHVNRYSSAIELSRDDRVVSWLPLYHDMGLITAFHLPLAYGIPSVQIDPFQWISSPVLLFQAITQEKGTLTWLPNFAYNFMADRIRQEDLEDINLTGMRMFINCSEVVRKESHEKFLRRFQKYGLKRNSLAACYAMAEATFAVTQTEPGKEAVSFEADRKTYISSGKPISGCALRILDKKGGELPEGRIGRVVIKSASLFDGYRNNPEKTEKAVKDGWYLSGDLGFCHDGEYYIIGREDDVIIVAGKNIYPEDIEDEVGKVPGIVPGRVIAFGLEDPESGTSKVCVIAESPCGSDTEKHELRLAVMQAGMDIDVTISEFYLVPPRWIIKSSSGKPSRKTNKERILQESGKKP